MGTVDTSQRTSNTFSLANSTAFSVYGNWVNGTGTTLTGTGTMTFAGRGSQTITSAGKTFTQPITINTPGGSVTLQDAFSSSNSIPKRVIEIKLHVETIGRIYTQNFSDACETD